MAAYARIAQRIEHWSTEPCAGVRFPLRVRQGCARGQLTSVDWPLVLEYTTIMSNVFFTSDQHWFHKLVTQLRGFGEGESAIRAHNDALIFGWESVVGKDDIVWVLGDLTVSSGSLPKALDIMGRLPGRKRLILGNHDPAHPMHRDAYKWIHKYDEVFEYVSPFARIKVAGKNVLLSHFPYTLDHTHDARFEQWRLKDEGEFLLHGHTHNSYKYSSKREMHVGVDAWDMAPVPLSEVERFVTEGIPNWEDTV